MIDQQQTIEPIYEAAKHGNWDQILTLWRQSPQLAQLCSRFQNQSSRWTFLHQAAYSGHEAACRELIRLGAEVGALTQERQSGADIAQKQKYSDLATLLRRASLEADSLWATPTDPNLLPSSNRWHEASERQASTAMCVAYGGGVVNISVGARYFVDSFERTLVGWHGSYSPPCGMDGMPMF